MYLFPYFELAASLFILLLAFHIYSRHYENRAARFYARLALVAFLGAILIYSSRIAFTFEIARHIDRFAATLWAFLFSMFAHFCLIFTKRFETLKNKWIYVLLYLPATLLGILFIFTDWMFLRYEIVPFGITSYPAPLYSLFMLHSIIFPLWGVYLLLSCARRCPQKIEKLQNNLIAVGVLIPLVVGIVTDEIFPVIFKIRIPPTSVFGLAFMNFFIYLAMRWYSLFAISPALAADIIIKTMPDSMLVTDLNGRILLLNEEAHRFFHVPEEEILGRSVEDLFEQRDKYPVLYDEVVNKNLEVERFEANLLDPLGERIPSLINANKLKDALGIPLGIVFIIRDICG